MMDYFETDLGKLIDSKKVDLTENDTKVVMKQILIALKILHDNYILHRDVKPSNVLVGTDGKCVLTDFGLARRFAAPDQELTRGVITRWYRPPEILFGARFYGEKVDVWGLGCIFAECFLKKPLFPGETDLDQLSKIFGIRGNPSKEVWPDVEELPYYFQFEETVGYPLSKILSNASERAVQLIEDMLQLDPNKRPKLEDLIKDEYFNVGEKEYEDFASKVKVAFGSE